ncbi:solute carrier family 22 member 5 isoform X3 [Esox lucius]|uniref:Major facilitator superfamily (MFS) profile domain-containing protein n=1 Tax=Esox lucius TaxID=8010 RepID=A0AAY5K9M6_ESOLU|nr:solute carrier family 22 member 5 isoform X3 [Esox lucius]
MRDFEETTAFLGQWGPFQLTVFFLLGVSIIPNGFSAFSVIFLGDSPTHHCFIPDAKNLSEVWRKAIIPIEVENGREENSKCSRYRLDVVRNLSALGYIPGLDINLTQVDQERCVDGWTYSDDIYQSTIVTEFDLVCSESWKQPFTSSLYFLGVLCGSFFSGQLSDWFIPESPRWLLSQGRVEEAEVILREAARKNRVTAPEVIFEESESEEKPKPEERHSPLDLLRPCSICKTTLIISLVWFTLSMGYFCISLNTSRLHGDPYINCFISAAIEVPAYISSWLLLRYLPRRLSTSASMLLGGAALYFIQLVPPSVPSLSIALEMMGKFGLATGTGLVFAYTAELYPTVIRNTALGFCAMISRVGSIIAPYIFTFGTYYKYLPYILLGSLLVLSAMTIPFLPETFGRPLPETIQQMHEQARIKCPCIPEKNRKPTKEANDTILLESSL